MWDKPLKIVVAVSAEYLDGRVFVRAEMTLWQNVMAGERLLCFTSGTYRVRYLPRHTNLLNMDEIVNLVHTVRTDFDCLVCSGGVVAGSASDVVPHIAVFADCSTGL